MRPIGRMGIMLIDYIASFAIFFAVLGMRVGRNRHTDGHALSLYHSPDSKSPVFRGIFGE